MTGWQKSQEMGDRTLPGHLNGLQNVGAKIGREHYRRRDTLDKIEDMVLRGDEE